MPDQLTLARLNGGNDHVARTGGLHNPHVLVTIDQLNAVWSGEYDVLDTIEVLRREAQRLISLADSIATNLV